MPVPSGGSRSIKSQFASTGMQARISDSRHATTKSPVKTVYSRVRDPSRWGEAQYVWLTNDSPDESGVSRSVGEPYEKQPDRHFDRADTADNKERKSESPLLGLYHRARNHNPGIDMLAQTVMPSSNVAHNARDGHNLYRSSAPQEQKKGAVHTAAKSSDQSSGPNTRSIKMRT